MGFLNWLSRDKRNRDLDDEIEAHLRMDAEDREARGARGGQARAEARKDFGNRGLVAETTRQMWGWSRWEAFLGDLRQAIRVIAKNRGWAAAVILSLAVGAGANTAIFSLTYAVVLKTLAAPDPGKLVRYSFRNAAMDIGLSGPVYDALKRHQTTSTDVLAWSNNQLTLDENGSIQTVSGGLMTGNGFAVLQIQPAAGTAFGPNDDAPGGGPSGYQALLGYSYWQSHFHGDPVVGRGLKLNGRVATITGVLPKGFDGLIAGQATDILLPLAFEEVINAPHSMRKFPGSFWLTLMGRLKPGQTLESARANLSAIDAQVRAEADPKRVYLAGFFKPFRISVESGRGGRSFLRTTYESPLLVLELLAALLLLLCCANTGLLVLAQVSGRAREFALRSALGAGRGRLLSQVLSEVAMLAVPGVFLAVALGWLLARSLVLMLSGVAAVPLLDVTPDVTVLGFTLAVTLGAAMIAGVWPAIRASRAEPSLDLKQTAQAGRQRDLGSWIIPGQVAVSVALVASALFLGSTFERLLHEQTGFGGGTIMMADVNLQPAKLDEARLNLAAPAMTDALEKAPGVRSAAMMSVAPLSTSFSAGHYFSVARGAVHSDMNVWPEVVSAGYFTTVGTRLVAGRAFSRSDLAEQVCIPSRSAAAFFFPGEDAVGKFIYNGGANTAMDGQQVDPKKAWRVVGVAEDVRFQSLREPATRMLYRLATADDASPYLTLAVQTPNKETGAAVLRDTVRKVVPTAPAPVIYTFTALADSHLSRERILVRLATSFAATALLLTAIGLFGLLMRSVAQRRREIGIRMALGARRGTVLHEILRRALWRTVIGLAAGSVIAWASARAMESLLYATSPSSIWVYAGAIAVILVIAAAAAVLPARRAASVDPAQALRVE